MSARQFIVAGRRILVGASWMPLMGEAPEKQEAYTLSQQVDAALQVRLPHETHVHYGFIDKASLVELAKAEKEAKKRKETLPKDKTYYSMGALFSQSIASGRFAPDAIMLVQDPVDQDLVHYCAFQNGTPDGNEQSGSHEKIRVKAEAQIQSGNPSVIYSNCGLFPESTRSFDFNAFFAQADVKTAAFGKISGAPFDAKKAVMLGGIAATVAFLMWDDIKPLIFPPPPPPPPVDYVALYQSNLPGVLASAGHAGRSRVDTVLQLAGDLPLRVGGWKTSELVCNDSGCSVTYLADPDFPATFATFNDAKPAKVTSVQYAPEGKRLVATWGTPEDMQANASTLPEALPQAHAFLVGDVSHLQRLERVDVTHTLGPLTAFGLPDGAPDGAIPPEILVQRGDFTLTGDAWMLRDLPIPNNVTVSEISMLLDPEGKKTFTIRGYYHVTS